MPGSSMMGAQQSARRRDPCSAGLWRRGAVVHARSPVELRVPFPEVAQSAYGCSPIPADKPRAARWSRVLRWETAVRSTTPATAHPGPPRPSSQRRTASLQRAGAAAGDGTRSARAQHGDAGGAAVSGDGDDWNLPVLLMAALSAGGGAARAPGSGRRGPAAPGAGGARQDPQGGRVHFEKGVAALRGTRAHVGSVKVPRAHVEQLEDGSEVKLGVFLSNSKSRRDKLTADKLAALAGLGLEWAA